MASTAIRSRAIRNNVLSIGFRGFMYVDLHNFLSAVAVTMTLMVQDPASCLPMQPFDPGYGTQYREQEATGIGLIHIELSSLSTYRRCGYKGGAGRISSPSIM